MFTSTEVTLFQIAPTTLNFPHPVQYNAKVQPKSTNPKMIILDSTESIIQPIDEPDPWPCLALMYTALEAL